MRTKKQNLSARMKAVVNFVTPGNSVCDVGCDHGYISIYLVQEGIAPHVLAMDIHSGPLERAREHVTEVMLQNYISLRLSDGLTQYQLGEAQTLICAGMGGPLMQKILTREPDKTADFKELILQPQSEVAEFRHFLRDFGYAIIAEDMVFEDGKFYPVIKAQQGKWETTQPELEDRYGPLLLRQQHPTLIQYLEKEWETTLELLAELEKTELTQRTARRQIELSKELIHLFKAGQICGMGGSK